MIWVVSCSQKKPPKNSITQISHQLKDMMTTKDKCMEKIVQNKKIGKHHHPENHLETQGFLESEWMTYPL